MGKSFTFPSSKPVKEGYVFKGWAAKRLGDQKWVSAKGWVSSSDVSANGGYRYYQPGSTYKIDDSWLKGYTGSTVKFRFYAQWEQVRSNVYFDLNGGSGSFATISATYGSNFTISSTKPTKSGYVFKGWALKRLVDQKWIAENGAWCTSDNVASNGGYRLYASGKERTLVPSWYKGCEGMHVNFRFYAQWQKEQAAAVKHTVSYNLNGGTGTYTSSTVDHGSKYTISSSVPVRYGYVFKGWALKRTADSQWSTSAGWFAASAVSSNGGYQLYAAGKQLSLGDGSTKGLSNAATNFELTAQWDKATASFSFGTNGGDGCFSNMSAVFGSSITLPTAKPTRYGYTFKGWALKRTSDGLWYTANGGWREYADVSSYGGYAYYAAGATRTMNVSWFNGWKGGNASYRFYAHYNLNAGSVECTAAYGLNGGSGTFATQTVVYGGPLTIHTATPTKSGYVFAGWACKRLNDSKWRSSAGRWVSSSEINDYGGYRLYQPGGTVTVNEAWSKQYTGTDKAFNYRFYAQWKEASGLVAGSIAK